jgi:exo-beta-1,3-glucanase (GH17 family)/cellulose synthase/poly-beta-1,6-N-acetylglucosamine synthase-like glycosyltransferase
MRALIALLVTAFALTTSWFLLDQPVAAPDWKKPIKGLSYNPSHMWTDKDHEVITEARLREDLKQLAPLTGRIRIYSVSRGLERIPAIAGDYGMKVSLGIWLGKDRALNAVEVDQAIRLIRTHPHTIDRVFVGNEAVGVREDINFEELIEYVRQVKRAVGNRRIEVGTAETWNTWDPQTFAKGQSYLPQLQKAVAALARECDFIGAHIIPYWEGVGLHDAVGHVSFVHNRLKSLFPGKEIVIGEIGWPSEGRIHRGSVPTGANQAAFVRRFLESAEKANYDYYIIEAYDQPWKAGPEGAVGAYWGILNAAGEHKVSLHGEITSLPNWYVLAIFSVIFTFIGGMVLLRTTRKLPLHGNIFLAALVGVIVVAAVHIVQGAALEYASWMTYGVFAIVVPIASLAVAVIVSEGIELAYSLWRTETTRRVEPRAGYAPKVSIHVPCYNEPPEMVIETVNALARLDYTNFEVIVLDNNTKDPAVWRPVEEHCKILGEKFRFFHLDNVKGFKAGALNEAMKLTAEDAEIVAVIDSDYQVNPEWLKVAVPYFADADVALVQAPQDYRDAEESLFKSMAYQEYSGFFRIGMVERDEDNAIIQHGTMTMMRKSVMEKVGNWAEWCITEDSELGLRIFEEGHEAVYLNYSLGRGLIPDTLGAFKGQRHRWAYGAMQILKRHVRSLFWGGTKLTLAQRYHFVAGWLPWIADALALVFVAGSLVWTVLMGIDKKSFDLPMASLATVALGLFLVKTVKTLIVYPFRVTPRVSAAFKAAIAGLALSHTVGKAVIMGLLTSNQPFLRTPKLENVAPFRQVLAIASEELAVFTAIWTALISTAVVWGLDEPVAVVWMIMLGVQSLPYAATVAMACISTIPAKPAVVVPVATPQPRPAETVGVGD